MKADPRLHHVSQNIATDSLEHVLEMYKFFDCDIVYEPNNGHRWAMVGQKQLRFAIQIVEVPEKPISDIEIKKKTHIAFLSDNPQEILKKIETWAQGKNIRFMKGGWSEKEFYFDLPDIFVNSVIEVMHSSIEE